MRLVETILTRDKNWVQWKAENCLSFEKKPVPEDEVKQSMDRAMEVCRPTKGYPHAMGAPALGRLWREANKNPGMDGLKRKERWARFFFGFPTMGLYILFYGTDSLAIMLCFFTWILESHFLARDVLTQAKPLSYLGVG